MTWWSDQGHLNSIMGPWAKSFTEAPISTVCPLLLNPCDWSSTLLAHTSSSGNILGLGGSCLTPVKRLKSTKNCGWKVAGEDVIPIVDLV